MTIASAEACQHCAPRAFPTLPRASPFSVLLHAKMPPLSSFQRIFACVMVATVTLGAAGALTPTGASVHSRDLAPLLR